MLKPSGVQAKHSSFRGVRNSFAILLCSVMSSPSKPQLPPVKRSKGDEEADDKDEDAAMFTPPRKPPVEDTEAVTLQAIGRLFEEKLEEKLNPMKQMFNDMQKDLIAFKETVRTELNGIGLEIKTIQSEAAQSSLKLAQLEEEMSKLKVGHTAISLPGGDRAERDITAVAGNIPGVT